MLAFTGHRSQKQLKARKDLDNESSHADADPFALMYATTNLDSIPKKETPFRFISPFTVDLLQLKLGGYDQTFGDRAKDTATLGKVDN